MYWVAGHSLFTMILNYFLVELKAWAVWLTRLSVCLFVSPHHESHIPTIQFERKKSPKTARGSIKSFKFTFFSPMESMYHLIRSGLSAFWKRWRAGKADFFETTPNVRHTLVMVSEERRTVSRVSGLAHAIRRRRGLRHFRFHVPWTWNVLCIVMSKPDSTLVARCGGGAKEVTKLLTRLHNTLFLVWRKTTVWLIMGHSTTISSGCFGCKVFWASPAAFGARLKRLRRCPLSTAWILFWIPN